MTTLPRGYHSLYVRLFLKREPTQSFSVLIVIGMVRENLNGLPAYLTQTRVADGSSEPPWDWRYVFLGAHWAFGSSLFFFLYHFC